VQFGVVLMLERVKDIRVRTHWSWPEDDGGRERNGTEEDGWAAIVDATLACRQSAEVQRDPGHLGGHRFFALPLRGRDLPSWHGGWSVRAMI
jgi:hypothetical protein